MGNILDLLLGAVFTLLQLDWQMLYMKYLRLFDEREQ